MAGPKYSGSDWPHPEPEGWRELQERARKARDPRELDAIIAEMNRLLSEVEKQSNAGAAPHTAARREGKPTSSSG